MNGTVIVDKSERRFVKLSSISPILRCSICMEVFFVPTRLFCGHTFCYDCLESCMKTKPNCPMCRTEADVKKVGKDLLAYNIINELQVFCIYEQCSWRGELELLQSHLNYECLLHSSSQTKRHKNKADTSLKQPVDDQVEEKINQNISNGSLISRAIKNNQSLKVGDKFDIARKMLQSESSNFQQAENRKNNKKKGAEKKHEDQNKNKSNQQDRQQIADFLMDLFQ